MADFNTATAVQVTPANTLPGVLRASLASTLHRISRGEGALLAVNLSVIAWSGANPTLAAAQALVSAMAILSMYAFNDFYDAPTDANNPKKDRALVATYLEHRGLGGATIIALNLLTVLLAFSTLGLQPGAIVGAVLLVNVVYSIALKGVAVIDVVWCGLWGSMYVAIVDSSAEHVLIIGLMTAICHLYQTLGDRVPDAANGILTTAVRSATLSKGILFALSLVLFVVVRAHLGTLMGLTAFAPLGFYLVSEAHVGWVLSKIYFGFVWLYLLGTYHAAG